MSYDQPHGNARSAPKPLELAWAAGLFDGEGHARFSLYKKRGYGQPQMTVSQCDREVLDRFKSAVGAGRIYGPYNRDGRGYNARPMHTWTAGKFREIERVADLLWPYLSTPKRVQIKGMLDLYAEQREQTMLKRGENARRENERRRRAKLKPNARQV